MVGGLTGIDGRASFGSAGGFMRVAGVPADEGRAVAAGGVARAASRDDIGAGELLVPE